MIQPGTRAIFFDAVGTLIHAEPPAALVYAEVGRRFGSRYSVQEISRRFHAAFEREEETDRAMALRTSEEREWHRWRGIVEQVLDDSDDPEACFQELHQHFSRPQAWRLDSEATQVLDQLAKQGYCLGLASNYDGRLRSVAAGLPGLAPISHLVVSSDVGWRKPAPAFFAELCRRVGLPPRQILFVGDDPVNDYEGAVGSGLQGALFDPDKRHATVPGVRIDKLRDLARV